MSQIPFSSLNLSPELVSNLESLNYTSMTPIQQHSLPHILEGRDIIAQSQTGSGKTAAFALGLLNKLEVKRFRIQSLVLCPTRELADQVASEIRRLGRSIHNIKVLTLCGGSPFGPQAGSLEHGAHIIVGTPGRVDDHLRRGTLKLNDVNMLVLDEADRMLDMGFQEVLDNIVDQIPVERQTLLFSATYPDQIEAIAQRIMQQPVMAQATSTHDSHSIEQHFFEVNDGKRVEALRRLLAHYQPESTVVFCNTKHEVQELADELARYGYGALPLHGDLEQKDRDQTLVRFMNNSVSILVATDVASRGLDIDALDVVINYHIAHEIEVHVHRIGRTGRAGKKGVACTLFNDSERYRLQRLGELVGQVITVEPLPEKSLLDKPPFRPAMVTLQIDGGKKQKLRPGDILGALSGENGIAGNQVGKIKLAANWAYVAVQREVAKAALRKLTDGKLKGRNFRVRQL